MDEEPIIRPLEDKARSLHTHLKLAGEPKNALLYTPDKLLSYILSVLRDETPHLPEVSRSKWSDLLALLNSHGILPLLYWKIGHLPPEQQPPENTVAHMRSMFMKSRALGLQMEKQLLNLLDAFSNAGIRALVLKGSALAWLLYPDPATRPFHDIDLLVSPEEFPKAREILYKIGYQSTLREFDGFENPGCEEAFIHQTNSRDNCCVELHWELHNFFGMDRDNRTEDLFHRAIEVEIPDLTFECLHWVDALTHAALHLVMTHNQDLRLLWIYDIALLAQKLTVPEDWKLLQERSSIWGARLSVEHSLKMAQVWTGLHLPKGFDDFSTWPKPVEAEISALDNAILRYSRPGVYLKLFLSDSPTVFGKALSLLKLIFPSPDRIRSRYPSSHRWLLPISYVRRWWRWFVKSIRR